MQDIDKLINDVYGCLSQPAATEIGNYLFTKKKALAKKLLKREEGHWLTEDQIDLFIEHEYNSLQAKSMTVKEIDKKDVIQTPLENHEKANNYLVRIGTMVFVAKCIVMRNEKGGQFMAPNHYMYTLSQVDQVFEINLK